MERQDRSRPKRNDSSFIEKWNVLLQVYIELLEVVEAQLAILVEGIFRRIVAACAGSSWIVTVVILREIAVTKEIGLLVYAYGFRGCKCLVCGNKPIVSSGTHVHP